MNLTTAHLESQATGRPERTEGLESRKEEQMSRIDGEWKWTGSVDTSKWSTPPPVDRSTHPGHTEQPELQEHTQPPEQPELQEHTQPPEQPEQPELQEHTQPPEQSEHTDNTERTGHAGNSDLIEDKKRNVPISELDEQASSSHSECRQAGCAQDCSVQTGRIICACRPGFLPASDGKSCIGIPLTFHFLLLHCIAYSFEKYIVCLV